MEYLTNFSAADIEILRGIVYRERTRPKNTTGRAAVPPYDDNPPPTTEVYIAKVPTDGIPALTHDLFSSLGDKPGHRTCNIYKIRKETDNTYRLQPVVDPETGMQRLVFNISLQEIVESDSPYVTIKREKFGSWLADGPGGGAGTGSESVVEPDCGFLILNCPGPGTGSESIAGTGSESGGIAYLCCDSFDVCINASTPIPAILSATVTLKDAPGGTVLATFSMPIAFTDTADYNGFVRAGWYGCQARNVLTDGYPSATVFLQCEAGEFKVTFNGFTASGHTMCDGHIMSVGTTGTTGLVAHPFAISNTEVPLSGTYASPTFGDVYVDVDITT